MGKRVIADAGAIAAISLGLSLLQKGDILTGSILVIIGVAIVIAKYKHEDTRVLSQIAKVMEAVPKKKQKKNA